MSKANFELTTINQIKEYPHTILSLVSKQNIMPVQQASSIWIQVAIQLLSSTQTNEQA